MRTSGSTIDNRAGYQADRVLASNPVSLAAGKLTVKLNIRIFWPMARVVALFLSSGRDSFSIDRLPVCIVLLSPDYGLGS